jgi:hypothetical protein
MNKPNMRTNGDMGHDIYKQPLDGDEQQLFATKQYITWYIGIPATAAMHMSFCGKVNEKFWMTVTIWFLFLSSQTAGATSSDQFSELDEGSSRTAMALQKAVSWMCNGWWRLWSGFAGRIWALLVGKWNRGISLMGWMTWETALNSERSAIDSVTSVLSMGGTLGKCESKDRK